MKTKVNMGYPEVPATKNGSRKQSAADMFFIDDLFAVFFGFQKVVFYKKISKPMGIPWEVGQKFDPVQQVSY